ncbi:uncharacterized protein LOC107268831 [Cephus cinctus]|uniref:Uncharacterized protein LOC107268831 n=1 Tax=Cephus cinctus TaxID=211228 RepID=A0AAJ7BYG6_CEPCN|nr:uncharacterized protein LOC107268831 [Cephus cinctus]XP_015597465.1 uncharacterized protein LOC107268831 [Cephus cinctus]XP_015597466.1 uncharacterized protein LOC107268831 [Cephus cinctus]XP_015597467.1 uncharacterized protein LOC107268831 [Cephus cinctus]XP_024941985.1 uncharacterized protein LOC107268831 [Cephus cinctus]
MEWIVLAILLVTLFVCPIWFYLWLNKLLKRQWIEEYSHYSVPDFHFTLKRWWASLCIARKKSKQDALSKMNKEYIYDKKLPDNLEDLQVLHEEDSSDSFLFYATDQKRNSLFLKLTRRRHRISELWLQLILADGRIYQLPNHPDTVISNNVSKKWCCAGLKIVSLESWRRWRITFNGLMRNGIRRNVNDNMGKIEHIRFNFIFIAGSKPSFWPDDWSTSLQADALAREPWKNPEWIHMICVGSGGFDQWGSLVGHVTFEDSTQTELYLHGLRQRRWGKHKAARFHRTVSFFGITRTGISFCFGGNSFKTGLTHLQFGHIKNAIGLFNQIDWMDFNLPDFAEDRDNIPTKYTINFRAGGKKYKTVVERILNTGSTLYGGRPWDWEGRIVPLKIELNGVSAVGIANLWYTYNGFCPLQAVPRVRHLLPPNVKLDPHIYVVRFSERICQSEMIVGGKGSSLALLTTVNSKEFSVPQGFCLTVAAFKAQLESVPEISEALDNLKINSTQQKDESLKNACEKIVALIENTPVIKSVADAVRKAVNDIEMVQPVILDELKRTLRFAVRSSAVGEDSEDTSAAGQNSTFLGIQESENVLKAVAKCWASVFAFQSVEYRRQHGLPIKSCMGVCVQIMVNAETAGVMFTKHPTTGDPRSIVITANYGLGETVVSAMVEPDTIIVNRTWDDKLTINEITLGKKTKKILMSDISGTKVEDISETESKEVCISKKIALCLAKLGLQLEALFGAPRDVEWAVSEGKIFLLQARPITTLDGWSDFEIIHELDSNVPSDIDVLSFANIGEVLPGVTSPLSLSTICRILNGCVGQKALCQPNVYYESTVCVTAMRCIFNYTNTMLIRPEKTITATNKTIDIAICGKILTTPEVHQYAVERNGTISVFYRIYMIYSLVCDMWHMKSTMKKAAEVHEKFNIDFDRFYTAIHLYQEITDSFENLLKVALFHSEISGVAVFSQMFLISILMEGQEELNDNHYSDIALLLSTSSDVISAQVPKILKEIAESIKASGKAEEFISIHASHGRDWLKVNCPSTSVLFEDFLKKHGHRCVKEFDLLIETWSMKPEKTLMALQAVLKIPSGGNVPEELTLEETIEKLKSPKKSATKWILKKVIPYCRNIVMCREQTKSHLVSVLHKIRLAYCKLSQLMTQECLIPDRNILFFLTHQEIGRLLRSPDPVLLRKAIKRRRLFPQLEKLSYPETIIGIPTPLPVNSNPVIHEGAVKVKGTSISNGSVLGRACVITDLSEASNICPGDILITRSTDIGWSPYFPLIGGVVTELGGLISHGAVVAREYGLPCLVGATEATQIFHTGDTVLLAGNTGILQLVQHV